MRIGEVAERSGLSTAMIRFYERRGILPGPGRRDNGYREYSAIDADRAATFARFRGLGIEAADAARLADQCATGRCDETWTAMPALISGHRAVIADRIDELQRLDARLAALEGIVTTGQSTPPIHVCAKEIEMLDCTCDGGCCGGPNGPCC